MRGQVSTETMMVVVLSISILLVSAGAAIFRAAEVQSYEKKSEIERSVNALSYAISSAYSSPGISFSLSLPDHVKDCSPSYTVTEHFIFAHCGDSDYVSNRYLASNVTNGTSGPPFAVGGTVAVEGIGKSVKVTS